uniref:Laminin N-terminal domain-containing protein n=1 Tax=Knipowitschia caucasica TaxID=637954 RepID=A0AAV2M1G5_KNICA
MSVPFVRVSEDFCRQTLCGVCTFSPFCSSAWWACLCSSSPPLHMAALMAAVYPATGNLLIGRAVNFSASSTCGERGAAHYCIVSHLQESDKCFVCDDSDPRLRHRIESVIYLTKSEEDEHSWWQSVNGEENVQIRLNLEAEFHFTHLIIKFKV